MVFLSKNNILWYIKNKSLRFKLDGGGLGELIIASLFDPTWLILAIGTPHHRLKAGFWVSLLKINLEEFFLEL